MPLKVNVPTGRKDWMLTKCPECGAQCWELPLAEVAKEQVKKAINAKWAFYWAKFMTEAATICRKYTHEIIEGKGTDHEYTHPSCDGCPFNVEKFGEHKICGCILSGPDDWDEPKVIGHIVRTIIREMAGGKK